MDTNFKIVLEFTLEDAIRAFATSTTRRKCRHDFEPSAHLQRCQSPSSTHMQLRASDPRTKQLKRSKTRRAVGDRVISFDNVDIKDDGAHRGAHLQRYDWTRH